MKFFPSKDQWIPGLIISAVTFVIMGMIVKKYGKGAAAA